MNQQESDKKPQPESFPDDNLGLHMQGHVVIRDAQTHEEIVNKRG